MLENVLDLLEVLIVVQLDEAKVRHDFTHGDLADAGRQLNFKLLQHGHEVILKSFHEQVR